MPLWRPREPLHERLAREGGLVPPAGRSFPWSEVGIHGVHRPREWDAVVAASAPGLKSSTLAFVSLPDELIVDGEEDVERLAEAVEAVLSPPYRAEAVRREGDVWAVAARSIETAELPGAPGDELELTRHHGETTLRVDGQPSFGSVPALTALVEGDGVVRARRIDGELWEVRVDPL